jgi:hypothetical protein
VIKLYLRFILELPVNNISNMVYMNMCVGVYIYVHILTCGYTYVNTYTHILMYA